MDQNIRRPKRPIDAHTLWQLSRIGNLSLAPHGRQAVCSVTTADLAKNQTRTQLWLLDTGTAQPRPLTHCGDRDAQAAWSPKGDVLAFVAKRDQQGSKDATPQLYLMPADGGEARRTAAFGPGVESFKWMPDGRRIVFAAWVWPELGTAAQQNQQHRRWLERKESGVATNEGFYRYWDHFMPMGRALHLLLLDVASGRIIDLFAGTELSLPNDDSSNTGYDVSPDGQHLAFCHDPAPAASLSNPLALSEMNVKTRRVRPLLHEEGWDFGAPRYSPDGHQLAATGAHVGRVHTALSQLVLVDRGGAGKNKHRQVLGADWDHAVNAPLRWSPDGRALYFTAEERGRCHLWRRDMASGQISVAHAGGWVQGFDVAAGVQVVLADSAMHPARVLALRDGQRQQRLESFNDDVMDGVALGTVQEVQLRGARDKASGSAVQMWLTFPPGFKPNRQHPITHVIHGGPFSAAGDTFSYRWNAHVFAAAGHVVAQVNFHGSSGFGHAFRHSLIGRQGALELQDIEAGTDWLVQQPWADKSRVFATGGSYGGFLVAWMNGHVPAWPQGRYRPYICHAGVFDRIATFSADSYPARPKDLAANYWQDMPRVLAQSPHASAARMDTPTLIIHGARDYRVPDCNGLAYYNTLKARGVEARLLWFADENHWVLKPQNSLQWYREFAAWLARFDKPKRASAAPRRAAAK